MRTYEAVMVFDPALEVEQVENDLRKLNDQISAGGVVRKWERWGKRRLAYEIKGRQYGYYVLTVFDLDPANVAELDRTLRINATIVRHLISVVEPANVPEPDLESVRTLGAAPESVTAPVPEAAALEAEIIVPEIIENGDVPGIDLNENNEPENIV
ncbi:30S ribosomal protein S6 [candidate division KSB1 bacterium]|nr:MAG: 30S ribosomal protein S6 [candidate division KSB1 bacterium]